MLNPYAMLAALAFATATFAGGFSVGKRWVEAEMVKDYAAAMLDLSERANGLITEQDKRWKEAISDVRSNLDGWVQQNEIDESLILQLIEGQDALRRDFREMENEIVVVDVGTCSFSDDAVRLLREATAAANRAARGSETGGGAASTGEREAEGGNAGV